MVPEALLSALFRLRDQLEGPCCSVAAGAARLRPRVRQGLQTTARVERVEACRVRLARQASDEDIQAAAHVMLQENPLLLLLLRRRLAGPDYRRLKRFAQMAGTDPRLFLRQLLENGARQAAADACKPQYVRLGSKWVKDARGKKVRVRPAELPRRQFLRWFRASMYRYVRQIVSESPRSHDSERVGKALSRRAAVSERARKTASDLTAFVPRGRSTPRQRELVTLLEAGYTQKQAAQQLGIAHSTLRVHLYRLRTAQQ